MKQTIKTILFTGSAVAALALANATAQAGGFALREQSTVGQGASFAGVAAGGALSSMFWNPATMTQFAGFNIELGASAILPKASHSYTNSSLANVLGPLGYANSLDNSADSAFVPSGYVSYQLAPQWWIGMSINAPYALSVSFPQTWAGAGYAQQSSIQSYNFAPAIAYQLNNWISIAVGAQIQYMNVGYGQLANPGPPIAASGHLGGTGYGYGFTAGVTLTPTPTTQIGVGYRSAINQKISGALDSPVPFSSAGSVSTTLNLPDMVTVGLRQRIGESFTLLAGFEWSRWSRIGTSIVTTPAGGVALLGGNPVTLPFQYSDGYFYSLGGEYAIDPNWTVRAGIAFEKSPITDGVRTPRLPDNDRIWYSVGSSYKPPQFKGLTFDLAYSYIDVKSTPINLGPGTGNPWSNGFMIYTGSVNSHIHIVSLSARYQFVAEQEPRRMLVTK